MSVSYTTEQQKVIDTHGCNLLVSAAAGSGKTAVLVERIVKMVSDGGHPVDIDRLLVVTFTNAAAAEMRERISNAIGEKLAREPENEHLQKQATLLHNAQITTIDSFCLFVIRNHFHTIGLDPGFRIADEGELKLLQKDVLSEVLEQCYQKGEASFLECMEYFSTGSRDSAVEEAVLKLYDFAMSNPFPEEWLLARKQDYVVPETEAGGRESTVSETEAGGRESTVSEAEGGGQESAESALMELEWMKSLMEETALLLQGMIDRIGQCTALSEMPDGPYMYGELLEQEKEQLESLLAAQSYEARYLRFLNLTFGRLSAKKDETVSAMKRELVKTIRTEVKEQLQAMQKNYFAASSEEIVKQMAVCGKAVCALVDLALLFQETFARTKREKNILDFDDIEHFALSILLRRGENGGVEATETALEYRSHFTEILIDEYQDSNLVQEYLLSAISGEAEGNFNLFMVGDVKQSIYKFRLARPELFMEKYHTYQEADVGDTLRIDLHKNFRSRKQVLTAANAVFAQVMRKELGGIVYDEKAALYPGAVYPDAFDAVELPDAGNDVEAFLDAGNDTELLLFTEDEGVSEADRNRKETASKADRASGRPVSAKQREAYGIARKIKELVTSFPVTDKETGKLRKASYKDIVILLRTTSGWDEEFKEILEEEGIPAHVASKTGYFASTEIQDLLHFLQILDNPLQDIPFYGVLHSFFGGFSEEEIAAVKAACPKKRYLYDAVKAYAEDRQGMSDGGPEAEQSEAEASEAEQPEAEPSEAEQADTLRCRLREFLEKLGRYREMTVYMPVHELLQTIIREYAYLPYVLAKPGGSRRRANTEMLLVKAADYEKTSYYGLYHFLRYIEQLEKYDVDYGEANLQDENADVVRIMSIHKSKGLEFPVCFVAGLAKSFNNRDTNGHLVMDVEQGIGVDYVNPGLRVSSRNLRRNFIAARLRKDNLAEELRILYVAMTRAKEKLFLTGSLKQPEKKILSLAALQWMREKCFPYDTLLRMGSFLDVLLYAAVRNQCFDDVWRFCGIEPERQNPFYREDMNFRVSIVRWEDTLEANVREIIERENDRRKLLLFDAAEAVDRIDKRLLTVMSEKFAYEYPYKNLKELYTKTTVSELKKAGMQEETDFSFPLYEEEQVIPYLPKFLKQDETVSGSDRGSAFHKVMELFDFKLLTEMDNLESGDGEQRAGSEGPESGKRSEGEELEALVRRELERMRTEGKLPQVYYDVVSVSKIAAFLRSNVAKRMAAAACAGKLYKEQPFVLGLSAERLNESFPKEETVLIQGIIDVFFEEKGSYVVVDYKTDAVDNAGELVRRYQTQLDYYAEALEQLSGYGRSGEGLRTSEKIIYSFKLGEEIRV